MTASAAPSPLLARLYRQVPALDSLRNYGPHDARSDLIAGLTVAAVAVPQAMAYAMIAGLPAEYGLYTAIVMTAVGALLDSSKQLINGPTNAISIAVLSAIGSVPGQDERIQAAVLRIKGTEKAIAVTNPTALMLNEFFNGRKQKDRRKKMRNGRVDLWVTCGSSNISFEAKASYPSAPKKSRPWQTVEPHMDRALAQVEDYSLDEPVRKLGVVFALPCVAKEHWDLKPERRVGAIRDLLVHYGLVEKTVGSEMRVSTKGLAFAAYYFPKEWKKRWDQLGDKKHKYVGVLLLARELDHEE